MKLNEFQKKVLEIWEDQKQNGVVISSPRQGGKTTLLLYIANMESKDKRVSVYGDNHQRTDYLQHLYRKTYGEYESVNFVNINSSGQLLENNRFGPNISLYDEIPKLHAPPYSMFIFTPTNPNIYIFSEDWIADSIKKQVERIKQALSVNRYRCEFQSNVIPKKIKNINWREWMENETKN